MATVIKMPIPRNLYLRCRSGTNLRQVLNLCTGMEIWVMEVSAYFDDGEAAHFNLVLGEGINCHAKTAAFRLSRSAKLVLSATGS